LQGEQFRDELRVLCAPLRNLTMSEPVYLSPQLFIAEGTERKCYRHPTEPDLCIKVLHPEVRPRQLWRELRYYRRLQRRGVDFTHLTRYRGLIDTSLGKGAIFDLVLDDDERISHSLAHYLALEDRDVNSWIVDEVERLKQDLYDQWIACHDLNPTNILVKRLSYDQYRLVVINGVGHNHVFPLASYSSAYARKKLVRAWNRRYQQWYAAFPTVLQTLKPYLSI
jgi:hypothetical protein